MMPKLWQETRRKDGIWNICRSILSATVSQLCLLFSLFLQLLVKRTRYYRVTRTLQILT